MGIQRLSLVNYRTLLAPLQTNMAMIYTGFAVIIAFGVVYSSARISLSERARELASLRVLGFGRGEALYILLIEHWPPNPPCAATRLGGGLPPVLAPKGAGFWRGDAGPPDRGKLKLRVCHGIVLIAALFSALVSVRERINQLDLVAVLKTRD